MQIYSYFDNLVLSCRSCNSKKGKKSLNEFKIKSTERIFKTYLYSNIKNDKERKLELEIISAVDKIQKAYNDYLLLVTKIKC